MNDDIACCLCSQIEGRREHDLISRLLDEERYIRRVALESEAFAVIPSLGPIVPGHTLLCPKLHVKSLACLPGAYDHDYQQMKGKLRQILRSLFRAPVHCFEHGSARRGVRVLCSVEHAHLHLLPVYATVLDRLRGELDLTPIVPTLQALESSAGDNEYLYYESPDQAAVIAKAGPTGFESQYMRRVFAEATGKASAWNWREDPSPREADRTHKVIYSASCLEWEP